VIYYLITEIQSGMSSMFKRLTKEFKQIQVENNDDLSAFPQDDSLKKWNVYIRGPEETPYAGGVYSCVLDVGNDYPLKPPTLTFKTKIFHPNISEGGGVCIDILKGQWSPVLDIRKIMISICSLLSDPNPSSPLNGTAGDLYLRNRPSYDKIASDMRDEFAMKTVIDRGLLK
jgi:ubiquitin-protein ligase